MWGRRAITPMKRAQMTRTLLVLLLLACNRNWSSRLPLTCRVLVQSGRLANLAHLLFTVWSWNWQNDMFPCLMMQGMILTFPLPRPCASTLVL